MASFWKPWKATADRKPRDPEDVAHKFLDKSPKKINASLARQKEQWERFSRAGVRASKEQQDRERQVMIATAVEDARRQMEAR